MEYFFLYFWNRAWGRGKICIKEYEEGASENILMRQRALLKTKETSLYKARRRAYDLVKCVKTYGERKWREANEKSI